MPRSRIYDKDVGRGSPATLTASSGRLGIRRHLLDLIPFLLGVALLVFVVLDNARG